VKGRDKGDCRHHSGGSNKNKDCYNCKKKGHIAVECWAKGGGKEGQGLKERKGKKN
jgi:hypothetical protein